MKKKLIATGLILAILLVPVSCAAPPPPVGDGVPPTYYAEMTLFGIEGRFLISGESKILRTIEATSEDDNLTVTIPRGTVALGKDSKRLKELEAKVDESPPSPPENASIIGLAFDFGPDGAMFSPPIILTWSYNPDTLPANVTEESLILAYYDGNEWIGLVCTVDTENDVITASVSHFTTFAIIGSVLPPPVPAPAPAPTPTELKVKDAAAAWNTALDYLRKHHEQNAPHSDIQWQEQDITPPGLIGSVTKEFASSEWAGEVSHAVLPLERTIYRVTLSSIKLGWHWEGSVKADGIVTEISAFKQMSEEESRKVAEGFARNSPTFVFDGIEDTLRLADTLRPRCPYCWVFVFEFDSRHAGYGDRTGQMLAQVITSHEVSIAVEQLEITSAVMDNKWDMIGQRER